jgi:hypothetical protein
LTFIGKYGKNNIRRKYMKFYTLKIFLDNDCMNQCKNIFSNKENIETNEFEYIDFKNIQSKTFEIIISQFSILFLPSNELHKSMDFEICLTFDSIDEWNNFIEDTTNNKKLEIETNYSNNIDGLYAEIGPKDICGPFSFIYNGKHNNQHNLIKITGEIGSDEYNDYKKHLNKIIDKDISKIIKLKENKYNENGIKSIELKTSKRIDILNENDIIKIKQDRDKIKILFE